jgi:hypothetical protein
MSSILGVCIDYGFLHIVGEGCPLEKGGVPVRKGGVPDSNSQIINISGKPTLLKMRSPWLPPLL